MKLNYLIVSELDGYVRFDGADSIKTVLNTIYPTGKKPDTYLTVPCKIDITMVLDKVYTHHKDSRIRDSDWFKTDFNTAGKYVTNFVQFEEKKLEREVEW